MNQVVDGLKGAKDHACFEGRGFVLELHWDGQKRDEMVHGRVVMTSDDGRHHEERRLELMPRFPQVFHFMGMYIHVSLSATEQRRTLYVSLPTKSKTQWRGAVAQWVRREQVQQSRQA